VTPREALERVSEDTRRLILDDEYRIQRALAEAEKHPEYVSGLLEWAHHMAHLLRHEKK
jgi:hypothetical protein